MGAGASVNHPAGNGKQSVHRVSSSVSGFVTHSENNLHSLFPNAHLQVGFFFFFCRSDVSARWALSNQHDLQVNLKPLIKTQRVTAVSPAPI